MSCGVLPSAPVAKSEDPPVLAQLQNHRSSSGHVREHRKQVYKQLEDCELIAVNPIKVTTKAAVTRNETLQFTLLPPQNVIDYHYKQKQNNGTFCWSSLSAVRAVSGAFIVVGNGDKTREEMQARHRMTTSVRLALSC